MIMKTIKLPRRFAMIYGFAVTALLLLVFLPTIVGEFMGKGFVATLQEMGRAFAEFEDNPYPFIIFYLAGYGLIWWKPLWGSVIIFFGCLYFFVPHPNPWSLIFILPAFLVGIFYIMTWAGNRHDLHT
jgi:hypothetical protein